MEATRTVKDVSPHELVNAYTAHLKRSSKSSRPSVENRVRGKGESKRSSDRRERWQERFGEQE
ncbi:hypothetical protein J1N35_037574 [Gossypium stocksii]|uniref:Uncharacterized protein n=1 Tax=Gossypium stocksii TaxID=47602 RepID=A0A9D3ZM04_9ROSI|nr:hypothetical protein J1N35_037574 [Gossypium stocksii]